MARQSRTFTREFKVEAVKLLTEQGHRVAEVAHDLDLFEVDSLGDLAREIERLRWLEASLADQQPDYYRPQSTPRGLPEVGWTRRGRATTVADVTRVVP